MNGWQLALCRRKSRAAQHRLLFPLLCVLTPCVFCLARALVLCPFGVSCSMLKEEGMDNVVARHHRLAEGTRKAVEGWGLELLCAHPR